MAFKQQTGGRARSAVHRARGYCLLLVLPSLTMGGYLLMRYHAGWSTSLLCLLCLVLYLGFVAASLIDTLVRPLQTLANVLSSLREGDYSFRARGAGAQDAMGELAWEVNALADLLQRQRVRSLEATALLARILEVMSAPLFAFDRNDRLQLINHAGLQLLGLPHARCFGRSAGELGLEELLQAQDQSIRPFPAAAGATRWLLRKAVFRQEGAPHTFLLLADVSLPLQEEERGAWKKLVRVLGHELSNSLAPIKSIAGSLLDRIADRAEDDAMVKDFRRGLGVIESRADSLHRFVQSYRKLAQLPPPQLQPVEMGPLLERVVLLEQRMPVRLHPGPAVTLNADADQLEQMMINLLANAVEAAQSSDAQPVEVHWTKSGTNVIVMIEDRGPGIANPDNLFVPFYTTKPTGSGVGLALAQQIARTHGGEIQLANREDGTGVRACVRLPLLGAARSAMDENAE
jgi:nitrogen fixation/metabolism regulation signal transduction histidine kinase